MLKHYILTRLRSLWKNRSHAVINIAGLTMGITSAIIIFLIVRFESSFDKQHADSDRIYRIVTEFTGSETPGYSAGVAYPLPDALLHDFPDFENVVLIDCNLSDPTIAITKESGALERFKETDATFVDPEYFKLFQYKWIEGDENALEREKTVVLTATLARKYFGDAPAINKVINFNNQFDVTVAGVIEDPPVNTDFPFQILLSSRLGADKRGWDSWSSIAGSINCYVKLNKGARQEEIEAKLEGWHLKYFTGENKKDGEGRQFFLQPLSEVHFDARFSNYGDRVVPKITLVSLSIIGVLLLLTACVNFINLNTVLIVKRSTDTGIRKVLGSSHRQLMLQFMGETFFITFISLAISALLAEVVLVNLASILGYQLSFFTMLDAVTIAYLALLVILVSLLSGLYPAIRLSRFQPVKILKSVVSFRFGEGLALRRSLIVFQLCISQALIVGTVIMVQQINYFMSKPLGINTEAVVEFHLPERKPEQIHSLKDRLQTLVGVESATMSNTGSISDNSWSGGFEATVKDKFINEYTHVKYADKDFVKTYQLKLLHGDDFIGSDTTNGFLVNEQFTKAMGFQDPADAVGASVTIWGATSLIRGVIQDFNTTSLHEDLEPLIVMEGTGAYYKGAVRLNTGSINQTLKEVQNIWESVYPNYVFEYQFLDEEIANFYDAERRNSHVMKIFAMVAILIGCIGLFGLVSFMVQQKLKEIGIRKTFGASVVQVIGHLSKEFIVLIVVSFILSSPVVFYLMEKWLDGFAYPISISPVQFLIGLLFIVTISALTVGYRTIRAAMTNPSDTLRAE